VEGYMDALALWEAGVKNVAATCGTALTAEHVRIIRGLCATAVLVFDSDTAGKTAAERSLPLFLNQGVAARVLVLPDGHDPDTFVRESGADAFSALAEKSRDLFSYLADMAVARHGTSPEGRARVAAEMTAHLAGLDDPVMRSAQVKELASRLNVDEEAVLSRLREAAGARAGNRMPPIDPLQGQEAGPMARMERRVLGVMRQSPAARRQVAEWGLAAHFRDPDHRALAEKMIQALDPAGQGEGPDVLSLAETEQQRRILARLAWEECPPDERGCEALVRQFAAQVRKERTRRLTEKIREAESRGDTSAIQELYGEIQNIRRLWG
ncbi:MAG: toprim domain-containing protein, partial [Deltaproteobacteria bacterium]|nr:toprim domain-containing protein [Deltaproteobacteria bacterium]